MMIIIMIITTIQILSARREKDPAPPCLRLRPADTSPTMIFILTTNNKL